MAREYKELLEVTALRDFLTEAYLRPPNRSFFDIMRLSSVTLRYEIQKPRETESSGINGFGVGISDDDTDPILYAFLDPSASLGAGALRDFERLELLTVVLRGRFVAAARPVKGGHCMGHGSAAGETGTMGCVVKDVAGDRFGLTCNHVIADLNKGIRGKTEVWCPGSAKGGTSSDRVGVLHDYVNLAFGGAYNDIDAAIAKPNLPSDLDPTVDGIGSINGWTSSISFGDKVKKSGDSTGVTAGKYRFKINGVISYSGGQKALFRDLLGIVGTSTNSDFAMQGDSGAVVLNDNDKVVGQVISVTTGMDLTLAAPIEPILQQLKVEPV